LLERKEVYTTFEEVSNIGLNVYFIRVDKGLTQKEVASTLGYKSTSFLNKIEHALEPYNLKYELISKLAKALEVEEQVLLKKREKLITVKLKNE